MLTIPKHRTKLFEILDALMSSAYGRYLGFKGGTLAYFLYGLDRFSTDLDFDLLYPLPAESKVMNDITAILSSYGMIRDVYNKTWTLFWLLDYEEGEMNIKVEINKRVRKNDIYLPRKILGTEMLCMEESSVFANKLVALTERKRVASRDLYDINFFFRKGFSINESLLLERTGKDNKTYLMFVKEFIQQQFHRNNLLAGLGEVLDEKQKIRVKEKLIENTLGYIDLYFRG